jgi:phi13 family phage major tail protein
MDQKYGEFIGVDNLHYALVSANDSDTYTAGAVEVLAPAAEIAQSPETNSTPTYYDNMPADSYVSEGKTDIKVVIPNLDSKTYATIVGKMYDTTTGQVYDNGNPNPPEIALGFRYNMGKNNYRYYWYLVGKFMAGEESAVTKKDNVEVKTYELTFTAYLTAKEFTVGGKTMPLKRIFADTSDANFKNASTWFSTVPVPVAV